MIQVSFPHGIICLEHRNLAKAIAEAERLNGSVDFAGVRVYTGEPLTEHFDTGEIDSLDGSGGAIVRWDSGVTSYTPTADINAIA